MQTLGPSIKRKSIQKVQPTLPVYRQPTQPINNGRTLYRQLKSPSEQLKEINKKQLSTHCNLSTEKSISNIHTEEFYNMRQNGFDDDHHNAQSMAQLLDTKTNSLLPTVRQPITERRETINLSSLSNYNKLSSLKDSLQSDILSRLQQDKKQEEMDENKQGQNYEDYVLGDKIDEQDVQQDNVQHKLKKYASDYRINTLSHYTPSSESQLRMQQQRIINERKKLLCVQEDRQIIAYLQQYQNNKRNIMNQTKTKHEVARIMAINNHPNKQQTMEKSVSLPALKPKQEIVIIPEESHYDYENKRNILAKNFNRQLDYGNQGKEVLSYGKLGFGRKKMRTICEQQIRDEQMGRFEQIKSKLRTKGIIFDTNKLKKGLISVKNQPQYRKIVEYPSISLPSNPIYKKFPL